MPENVNMPIGSAPRRTGSGDGSARSPLKVPKLSLRRTTSAPTSDMPPMAVPGDTRRSSRLGHTEEVPESARSAALSALASARLDSPSGNSPTHHSARRPPVPKLPLFGAGAATHGKALQSPLGDSSRRSGAAVAGAGVTIPSIRTSPAAGDSGRDSHPRDSPLGEGNNSRPVVPRLPILGGVQPGSGGRLSAGSAVAPSPGKGSSRLSIVSDGDKENAGGRVVEAIADPLDRLAEVAEESSGSESSRGGSTNRSADGQSPRDSPDRYPPGYELTGDLNEDCEVSEAWERELAACEVSRWTGLGMKGISASLYPGH